MSESKSTRYWFYGPSGLRVGWRLLIFSAILFVLFSVRNFLVSTLMQSMDDITRYVIGQQFLRFAACLLATWIMSRIEKRAVADYGLPWRRMFRGRFWQGAMLGFASITVLLGALHLCGVFDFGTITLHAGDVWKWAGLYALVFIIIGFSEEFFYRGYAQFTLTDGIGFWPAAVVWSALFGFSHSGNTGETWFGMVNAAVGGLFFCLMLQRTGNLWMPIGFHTAWNWGETYFYGVANSGVVVPGHLFDSGFSGPVWLTGGTVGPEGSVLATALFVVLWFIVAAWLGESKYPGRAMAVVHPLPVTGGEGEAKSP